MRTHSFSFLASILLLCLTASAVADTGLGATPWQTLVVGTQVPGPVRLAVVDLQRYIEQASHRKASVITPEQWLRAPRPAIAIGTTATNSLIARSGVSLSEAGEQGFALAQREIEKTTVLVCAANTPEGSVNAIYGLLREAGFGFYLGSEGIPERLPAELTSPTIVRSPAFKIRGVLPWYNFFDSPTAWELADHRALVDQLVRMGANFVGFHTYDTEPFGAICKDGKVAFGARLLNTGGPTWGTKSLATKDFAGGTGNAFTDPFFGAGTTLLDKPDATVVSTEQDGLNQALLYAKSRGLHTCVGFEVSEDPTTSEEVSLFTRRFENLLDRYPGLDYVWLWEPEAWGAIGHKQSPHNVLETSRSALSQYAMDRAEYFQRPITSVSHEGIVTGAPSKTRAARLREGARLEQYALLAHRILARRENAPRLIISGWGGDERLLSAEYYEGLDKLLPKDVIFASLDHIIPRTRIDRIYHDLPADRERWPIPWLEYDGDQWHAQPYVHTYEGLVRDALKSGSQGMLGIHWRTRDIEQNLAYLVESAWNPGISADDFFRGYAARCYDGSVSAEMADVHAKLDKLGYRWVGGGGQSECGSFSWGAGEAAKIAELKALRERTATLASKAPHSKDRFSWLLACMDWTLKYTEAEQAAQQADALLTRAVAANGSTTGQLLASKALDQLSSEKINDALQVYCRRLSTRGEYGVLATINAKAVPAWRDLTSRARTLSGTESTTTATGAWPAEKRIVLPRFFTSAVAGREIQLEPVVLSPEAAFLHYRALPDGKWHSRPLRTVRGLVRQASIPAEAAASPGVEFGFGFDSKPEQFAWGPSTVSTLPSSSIRKTETKEHKTRASDSLAELHLQTTEHTSLPLVLKWDDVPSATSFRVYCNNVLRCETASLLYPEFLCLKGNKYRIDAVSGGKVIARSKDLEAAPGLIRTPEPVKVAARANGNGVRVTWTAPESLLASAYRVYRTASEAAKRELAFEVPVVPLEACSTWDLPGKGHWLYEIVPLDGIGNEGPSTTLTIEVPPQRAFAAMDLPLTTQPAQASLVGTIPWTQDGGTFGDGYLVAPAQDLFNLANGLALRFEFKAEAGPEMPVLLCSGQWQEDGWYCQILDGKLLFRSAAGDVWGPTVEMGKWYSVSWVFDGVKQLLSVNGKLETAKLPRVIPSGPNRSLIIGQYTQQEPRYSFKGQIRNLTIWENPTDSGLKPE